MFEQIDGISTADAFEYLVQFWKWEFSSRNKYFRKVPDFTARFLGFMGFVLYCAQAPVSVVVVVWNVLWALELFLW